jgi:beta-1,3-galactosyltransferase 1
MMMLEQIHFKDNNESQFYANKNYFYPTKVRIISTPWNVCVNEQGKDLDALIYLWIRVSGFELRNTIRKTWANRTVFPTVNVVFVLGLSVDPALNLKVIEENERYGDIIQGDFIDAYRNLSFKSYIQWRWTTYMCRNAKYNAKQDDDVMLNTPVLVKFLNNKAVFNPPEVSISGQVFRGSVVDRNKNSKFYVSLEEWPEPVYKTYTNGPFYVNFCEFYNKLSI